MFDHVKPTKKIKVYGLSSRSNKTHFYTITNSPEECKEYASNIFKLEREEHFKSWCELKGVDSKDPKSWEDYYEHCVLDVDKNEYIIVPMEYKWEDILAVLRMFAGCIPLNCSFDRPTEIAYFKTMEETRLAFEQYTKKFCEDMEDSVEDFKDKKGYDA